ncbi:MAG: L7Ae/L30e/S12e/Gadd45 family ribosomal protein [Longimicrobiaceae bacterium]
MNGTTHGYGCDEALKLLGLAARAGAVLSGTERVRRGARNGTVRYVILGSDAAAGQRSKLEPLLRARGIPFGVAPSQRGLGEAIGRGPLSAAGITDAGLAARLRELLDRGAK